MFNRTRSMAMGLLAGLAGLGGRAPIKSAPVQPTEEEIVKPTVQTRRKVDHGKRPAYRHARYNGGKHRSGCDRAIMQTYVDDAQAKRDRKNAKRAHDHAWALVNNPCITKKAAA
ncbi:hypothetical protein [Xanthomonas virus PB119]|nr:hypothetical protein [Xanthomonas virus PB119]